MTKLILIGYEQKKGPTQFELQEVKSKKVLRKRPATTEEVLAFENDMVGLVKF